MPLAYSAKLKENYANIKLLLELVKYEDYQWEFCCDLKVVNIAFGLPLGWPKFPCPFCKFDSRDKIKIYYKKWPSRTNHVVGEFSIVNKNLIKARKIIIPPLHMKLGAFASFIKWMESNSAPKMYLKKKFHYKSESKINNGQLNGPEIRKLIKDSNFKKTLNKKQLNAFNAFIELCNGFFGNKKARNYKSLVSKMIQAFQKCSVRESTKLHMLNSHLNLFSENLGDKSDEHGERFHQELSTHETRYKGQSYASMLADFVWSSVPEQPNMIYNRK